MFVLPFATSHTTRNSEAMQEAGFLTAKAIPEERPEAFFLLLQGELGSGKTTFVQGLARGLGIEEKVLSPTFVIIRSYKARSQETLHHIDCYRLDRPEELLELGWEDIRQDPKAIVALEWPERVASILPAGAVLLEFDFGADPEERVIRTA